MAVNYDYGERCNKEHLKILKENKMKKVEEKKKRIAVTMSDEDIALLKEIYALRSYSGNEEPLRRYIKNFLDARSIPYENFNGNIIGINHPGKPIISAHMDMINTDRYTLKGQEDSVRNPIFEIDDDACIRLFYEEEITSHYASKYQYGKVTTKADKTRQQTSLGADDKNGIFVLLKLLEGGVPVNFVLTHGEECGMIGSRQIVEDEIIARQIEGCQYAIVIDRKNSSDIIGYKNKYCLAMDDRLEQFAKQNRFSYKCERGVACDMDKFSALIEGVNLSCGYYKAHSKEEYTNLNELKECFNFVKFVVLNFDYQSVSAERIREFKDVKRPYTTEADKKEAVLTAEKKNRTNNNLITTKTSTATKDTYSSLINTRGHIEGTTRRYSDTAEEFFIDEYGRKVTPDGFEYEEDIDNIVDLELFTEKEMTVQEQNDIVAAIECEWCNEKLYITNEHINEIADNDITFDALEVAAEQGIILTSCRCPSCWNEFDLGAHMQMEPEAIDAFNGALDAAAARIGIKRKRF